jgi:hypothetical protein
MLRMLEAPKILEHAVLDSAAGDAPQMCAGALIV